MLDGTGVQQHLAVCLGGLDARHHTVVDDRAGQLDGTRVVTGELTDRVGDALGHLGERPVPVGGLDAVPRNQHVLRGGAHLSTVEAQREAEVAAHPGEVVGGVHDDRVDAGLLGVHVGLPRVGFQPVAELCRAGEVDDFHLGPQRQRRGELLVRRLGGQLHQVRVEAGLGEHLTGVPDGDRQRQYRPRVRLDDDRVAGRERGEQARVRIPRRERVAADDERDAAGYHMEGLAHPQRLALAGRLLPPRLRGMAGLLGVRVRQRLQRAVQRVRATGLERHDERLPGGVLHRVGQFEDVLVQRVQDFQAHPGAGGRSRVAPRRQRRAGGRDQGVRGAVRVAHVQGYPERRRLGGHLPVDAGLVEREVMAEVGAEGGLPVRRGVLAVHPGTRRLGEGGPVPALGDRGQRALERVGMLGVQLVADNGGSHAPHHAAPQAAAISGTRAAICSIRQRAGSRALR